MKEYLEKNMVEMKTNLEMARKGKITEKKTNES